MKRKRKNICLAVYNIADYGGINTVAGNLVDGLCEDYNVFVLSLVDDNRKSALEVRPEVHISRLIHSDTRLRKELVKITVPLIRYLHKNRIDVIILMGHYTGFLCSPAKSFVKTKFIFSDHGALVNQWDDKKARYMRLVASKTADQTVTLTEKTKIDYIDKFKIKRDKISCIYNWIGRSSDDSSHYNLESKKIISVGRLSAEKGFDQLIEIMDIVSKEHPDWSLDIYGDGEMQEKLATRIGELRLNNIALKGRCDRIRAIYKEYSLYVMSSYREGLPMTLLEAKMNKLPIVSFDVDTGPREIIRNGIDGVLVEAKNISSFAKAVSNLIENENMRKRFSERTEENLNQFSKNSILPLWENLIDNIC